MTQAIQPPSLLPDCRTVRRRHSGRWLLSLILLLPAVGMGLQVPKPQADAAIGVIGFELCDLDANGLVGPADGKRALDYEFCIPAGEGFAAEVRAIDDSARFHPGSRGRIGCGSDEVLVLGNTHRPDFAFVLQRLAELPYVARIERAWFE